MLQFYKMICDPDAFVILKNYDLFLFLSHSCSSVLSLSLEYSFAFLFFLPPRFFLVISVFCSRGLNHLHYFQSFPKFTDTRPVNSKSVFTCDRLPFVLL